nr:RNA-directed DNA polymerase, eukaryota [Tanacetum cinerariifolium]
MYGVKMSKTQEIAPEAIIDRRLPFEYIIASRSTYVMVWNAVYDAHNKVACLMLESITPELHRQFENVSPYEMLQEFKSMFEKQAGVEHIGCWEENSQVTQSFRREPRGGIELQQLTDLATLLDAVILNNSKDRWYCDLSGDGEFWVKELRNFIDDKDCLPTRTNLEHRGVDLLSSNCPICHDFDEDINHSLFRCDLAQCVLRRVCRWWNFDPQEWSTFLEWQTWFLSLRLASKNKVLLEGVFYIACWSIWRFRNHCVFDDHPLRCSTIFDDIILHSFNWFHSRSYKDFEDIEMETKLEIGYLTDTYDESISFVLCVEDSSVDCYKSVAMLDMDWISQ